MDELDDPHYSPGPRASRNARDSRPAFVAAMLVVVVFATVVRIPFLGMESWDYTTFFRPWHDLLRERGSDAFATRFSDYPPLYHYLLALTTLVPLPALAAVKSISLVFDLVLAVAVLFVARNCGLGRRGQLVAFALVLLAPTVVLNSAAWAQSDAIYVSLLVAALACLQSKRPAWAMLLVGLGLAFKIQTVFLFPVLAVLFLRGELPWRTVPLIAVPYALAAVPAWLLGRPLMELVMLYRDQAEQYPALTMTAPSLYALIHLPEPLGPEIARAALATVGLATLATWRFGPRSDARGLLTMALFFAVLVPFVLPHMHDRYWFLADVLAVAYAVVNPRRWFVPVLVVSASLGTYLIFLWKLYAISLDLLAWMMLAALLIVGFDVFAGRLRTPAAIPAGARRNAATKRMRQPIASSRITPRSWSSPD